MAANMDQFEAYFQIADLNKDGRISGDEAVAFFQGSNLPKNVLAQIWTHADQGRTGFLGRQEFYNALKLVTVAQSKRELTPEIVKAALFSPAASKIPAPKINLAAISAPQPSPMAAAPASQIHAVAPTSSQNFGFRGQVPPNASMNQQYYSPQGNQLMRPPSSIPPNTTPRPPQGTVGPGVSSGGSMASLAIPSSNVSSSWLGGHGGGTPLGGTSQVPSRGISPPITSVVPRPQDLSPTSLEMVTKDSKTSVASGNGFASGSVFGGDVFSATPSQVKQVSSAPTYSSISAPASSAIVPAITKPQSVKPDPLDALQSTFTQPSAGGQPQRPQALMNQIQQSSAPNVSSFASPGVSVGVSDSNSNQSQVAWPKMKPADIQKYTKVFVEVDTDRDGKITGEQARNLFLSWRLPREVLKQVWDLADQDNDSMLSLREFCIALYLMERYREGCPLPATLPSNILFDDALLPMTGQSNPTYGNAAWGVTPGLRPQLGFPGPQQMTPAGGLRPPGQLAAHPANMTVGPNQQKPGTSMPESSRFSQLSNGEQNVVDSKFPEETVEEVEKVILDSREKLEFYRTKMQDIVLYKSRCDNRLNEITERSVADKREAEMLGKKYEEKYKQVAEIASKLTIEEAKFRDVQERMRELQQAIVNMEQGGSADGILQVRADRIQSDFEELQKALSERCRKHGLHVNSTVIIRLPPGWQPGIQEGAAVWDEDWDKFEDEGLSFGKESSLGVQNVGSTPDINAMYDEKDKVSASDGFPDSLSKSDMNSEKLFGGGEDENESGYAHSEGDMVNSHPSTPGRGVEEESPSREYADHFRKSTEADSETHGSFDESTWGAFDNNNDDIDSVWGFNTSRAKDTDHDKQGDKYFFGSDDFGVSPIRTQSSQSEGAFMKSSSIFADSVPATPASKFGNSPRYSEAGDYHFDNFSRFDSFSTRSGFSPPRETLTRFDSISSSREFPAFDDNDPFGSSGPFKALEGQTPKKSSDHWGV
ncbi:EH domain [Dillenia turbinata]|uniref:EH domain n=1 Tax=Dillenia turbinata TaxID=194707 RepID=A0AAN8ZLZ1_9MAGN